MPRIVTAGMIREVRRTAGRLKLPGLPLSQLVRKTRSILQGDLEGPTTFNIVVDQQLVKPFLRECELRGWGVEIAHEDLAALEAAASGPARKKSRSRTERLPLLLFADNFQLHLQLDAALYLQFEFRLDLLPLITFIAQLSQ